MLKEKLMSIHAALGIVEKLSEGEEMKKLVELCRHNLEGTAEQAEELEKNLVLPAEKMLEVVSWHEASRRRTLWNRGNRRKARWRKWPPSTAS